MRKEQFDLGAQEHVFYINVGFTTSRPVRPDEKMSRVQVSAKTETEAHRVAAQMVAGRPGVEMPTSTKTHMVEV